MTRYIYRWFRKAGGVKEGEISPKWLLAVRFVLFPLQSSRWWLNDSEGYQIHTDTWKINGLEFSSTYFEDLANKAPYWYRVKSIEHGVVTFEAKAK